jgi:hypothetical protein
VITAANPTHRGRRESLKIGALKQQADLGAVIVDASDEVDGIEVSDCDAISDIRTIGSAGAAALFVHALATRRV